MMAATVPPLETRRGVVSPWLITAAIMALAFLLRVRFWGQPLEMDEGLHAYMGWGWLQGLVPFKDMYNTKPPGIYLLHSLLFLVVEPTALNIKAFAAIYSLGTILVVFLAARKLAGQTAGCLAALLYAIFSCGPNIQGGGVNSEVFMVLPYTLSAYALIRAVQTSRGRHHLQFGFWTGLACTIKQVAAVNLFWWAAACLVAGTGWRKEENRGFSIPGDVLRVAAGLAISWIPFLVYFHLNGALSKFGFWMINANFLYMGDGYQELPNLSLFLGSLKDVLSENAALWLLALLGVIHGRRSFTDPGASDTSGRREAMQRRAWGVISWWPLFSLLGVALGGRFFAHYYIQIIPSLAIPGGAGLLWLVRRIGHKGMSFCCRPAGLAIALAIVASLFLFIRTDGPYYLHYNGMQASLHQYRTPLFSVTRFIGYYLRDHTEREDLIYVWAVHPEINFYALRRSPSPFLIQVDFDHLPWDPYREVMDSLHRDPPEYIVAMQPLSGFPALRDYVKRQYRQEAAPELAMLKRLVAFEIYRRKAEQP